MLMKESKQNCYKRFFKNNLKQVETFKAYQTDPTNIALLSQETIQKYQKLTVH